MVGGTGLGYSESASAVAEEGARSQTQCFIWYGQIVGNPGWDQDPEFRGRPFEWNFVIRDEAAAQCVLPLQIEEGETYIHAFLRNREPADRRRAFLTGSRAFARGDSSYSHDYRCYDKNGQLNWIHEDVSIKRIGYGRWRAVGVCTNVTEHKAAEEALQASEQRFSLFMQYLPGVAFIKDAEGRVTFVNENHRQAVGWECDEWRGKTVRELFGADASSVMDAHDRHVLETGEPLQAVEIVPHADGNHTYIVSKFPIVDSTTGQVMLGGIGFDISDRVRAEEHLRFQKTVLESVIEASRDGVLLVGEDGKWLSSNGRFAEIWDIPEEILAAGSDERALEYVHGMLREPDEFLRRIQHLYENPTETGRDRLELRDGRVFERDTRQVIGPDGTRYGRVWFFHDATEEERAQEKLRELSWESTMAEERERKRIASTLHDEVGQMLTIMNMKLHEHIAKQTPAAVDELTEFRDVLDSVLSVTRDLTVELSPPVLYQFGLYAALRWLGTSMILANGIRFNCHIEAEPAVDDETRLVVFRAVRELLHNVVKHARAKSVDLRAWEEPAGTLRITVKDDGIGDELSGAAASRCDRSNSFGLFSLRERLKHLGGSLAVESGPQGTCATLTVPLNKG